MRYLIPLLWILFSAFATTPPKDCCKMTPIPDGYKCGGPKAVIECVNDKCTRWKNCLPLVKE